MGMGLGRLFGEHSDRSSYDRQYSDKDLLFRILHYFTPYKIALLILCLSLIFTAIFSTLVPVLISETLDQFRQGIANSEIDNLIFILLLFSVFSFLMNMAQQYFTYYATSSAVYDLRSDVFNALLQKDMTFFDHQPSGRLASRIANDTQDFGQTVELSANTIGQFVLFFFLMLFLFSKSIKLTLLTLMFIPIIFLVALGFRKYGRSIALSSQQILAKLNALIQELTSGIYIAKSFRAENYIYAEFAEMNKISYHINYRRGVLFSTIFPSLTILTGIATAIIVYFGAFDLLNQNSFFGLVTPDEKITIGDFFLFIQGLNLFFMPMLQITSFWSQFQQGLASAERIFALIDLENKVIQFDNKIIENPKGEIVFKDLTFGYTPERVIFENFSLNVKPGEKLAIVGHTGAGKSSLVKLISRAYEFQSGSLTIDGYDIRSLDVEEYRKNLATITQEVFLWNSSIRDNLTYGLQLGTKNLDGLLNEVLLKVEVLEWINELEHGLDTVIGERGSRLSMGERQLISFARILLQDPSILIMDEATASVDPLTELSIQHAINILLEGRTSIVVAHRLSTIKQADRIIVIDQGKIVEEGTHDGLMQKGGYYSELYNTYYRHQSLEYIESMAKEPNA
jgi:ABC-type multidrug transport system fused ATPase/permease subunit